MSRQLEADGEDRQARKNNILAKALDTGLADALESQGIELVGIAFKYDFYSCLMTIKARFNNDFKVCFIGSDSIKNCILKAYSDANNAKLHWKADKYRIDSP